MKQKAYEMISCRMVAEDIILDDHIDLEDRSVIYAVKIRVKGLQERLDDIAGIFVEC